MTLTSPLVIPIISSHLKDGKIVKEGKTNDEIIQLIDVLKEYI